MCVRAGGSESARADSWGGQAAAAFSYREEVRSTPPSHPLPPPNHRREPRHGDIRPGFGGSARWPRVLQHDLMKILATVSSGNPSHLEAVNPIKATPTPTTPLAHASGLDEDQAEAAANSDDDVHFDDIDEDALDGFDREVRSTVETCTCLI